MPGWSIVRVAVLSGFFFATVSCSGGDGAASPSRFNDLVAVPKNVSQWTLPMDEFRIDIRQALYARSLGTYACVTEAGYGSQMARPQPFLDVNPVRNRLSNRRLFDVEIAQEFGYHENLPGGRPQTEPTNVNPIHDTPEGQAVYEECTGAAIGQLPDGVDVGLLSTSGITSSLADGIALEASTSVESLPSLEDAAGRWRTCMEPLGIPDLPDLPILMPSSSLAAEFGLAGEVAVTGLASADEIRVAVADAECRESSGYTEMAYEAEWDKQLELMAGNEDELARAKAAHDELQALIEDTIERYGEGS